MKLIMENWRRYQQDVVLSEAKPNWPPEKDDPEEEAQARRDRMKTRAADRGDDEKMSRRSMLKRTAAGLAGAAIAGPAAGKVLGDMSKEKHRQRSLQHQAKMKGAPEPSPEAVTSDAPSGEYEGWTSRQVKKLSRPFLDDTEVAIANYLKENADDFADRAVPSIPMDGDIIESFMKRTITQTIARNADKCAECIVDLITPQFLASLDQADPDGSASA
jgi:hypothetical protein